jgi:signal peptidase II
MIHHGDTEDTEIAQRKNEITSLPKANMKKALRLTLLLSVALSCVGCDQATKYAARTWLSSAEPIALLNGLVRLEYAENPGAFLSLGANLPNAIRFSIFVVFVALVLMLVAFLIWRERKFDRAQLFALALLMGGGVGNLIDRVINEGRVVDFVSFGASSLRTGIMNLADLAVTAGALVLLAGMVRHASDPRNHTKAKVKS